MSLKRRLGTALLLAALAVPSVTSTAKAATMMQAAQEGRPSCADCGPARKAPIKRAEPRYDLGPGQVQIYNSENKLVRSVPLTSGSHVHERITCDQYAVVPFSKGNLDSVQYGLPKRLNNDKAIDVAKDRMFLPDEVRDAGGNVTATYAVRGFKGAEQKRSYNATVSVTLDDCVTPAPQVQIENKVDITVGKPPAEETITPKAPKPREPAGPEDIISDNYRRRFEVTALAGKSTASYNATGANNVATDSFHFNPTQFKLKVAGFGDNYKVHAALVTQDGRDGGPNASPFLTYVPTFFSGYGLEVGGTVRAVPLGKHLGVGLRGQFQTNSISTSHPFAGTTSEQRNNYYDGSVGVLINRLNRSHVFLGVGLTGQPVAEAYGVQSGGYYSGHRTEWSPTATVDGAVILGRNARIVADFSGNYGQVRTAYSSDNQTLKGNFWNSRLEIAPRIVGPIRGVVQFSYGVNNNTIFDNAKGGSFVTNARHGYNGWAVGGRYDGGHTLTQEEALAEAQKEAMLKSHKQASKRK